jgi:hypothetical protein
LLHSVGRVCASGRGPLYAWTQAFGPRAAWTPACARASPAQASGQGPSRSATPLARAFAGHGPSLIRIFLVRLVSFLSAQVGQVVYSLCGGGCPPLPTPPAVLYPRAGGQLGSASAGSGSCCGGGCPPLGPRSSLGLWPGGVPGSLEVAPLRPHCTGLCYSSIASFQSPMGLVPSTWLGGDLQPRTDPFAWVPS